MSLTKRHAEKMGWFDAQGYHEYDIQYDEYKKKMDKDEVIEWIYNLPLQTLTDELKDDIVEKIEELTTQTQDDEKRFNR